MKKLVVMLAVVGLMAAPSMAGVGILNTAGTAFATHPVTADSQSGYITITLGLHLPTAIPKVDFIHFDFVYDAAELAFTAVNLMAPFQGTSQNATGLPAWLSGTITAPGTYRISSNVISVGTPSAMGTMTLASSVIYPLLQIQFFQFTGTTDAGSHFMDFWMPHSQFDIYAVSSGMMYYSVISYVSTHNALEIVPEPGSIALLLGGFACVGGGLWRRRR